MPYGEQFDEIDCVTALEFIQPDRVLNINIKNPALESVNFLKKSGLELCENTLGNIKARERMKIQYAIANSLQGIVVGTGQAAEMLTGFFTKGGDGVSDISPIACLNKRQGRSLLKTLNCPKSLYLKVPTADLETLKPGRPDEEILGISYEKIDDYLEGKVLSSENIAKIEKLFLSTQHKR